MTSVPLSPHDVAFILGQLRRLAAAHLEISSALTEAAARLDEAAASKDRRGLVTLGEAADRILSKLQ